MLGDEINATESLNDLVDEVNPDSKEIVVTDADAMVLLEQLELRFRAGDDEGPID